MTLFVSAIVWLILGKIIYNSYRRYSNFNGGYCCYTKLKLLYTSVLQTKDYRCPICYGIIRVEFFDKYWTILTRKP